MANSSKPPEEDLQMFATGDKARIVNCGYKYRDDRIVTINGPRSSSGHYQVVDDLSGSTMFEPEKHLECIHV